MTDPTDSASWRDRLSDIQNQLEELFPPGEAEQADEAFAANARSGALGRQWQVLQGRIDLRLTTRDAILSGEDDSVEALLVREVGVRQSDDLVEALRAQATGQGKTDPVAEFRALHESATARSALLRDIDENAGGPR